MNLSESEFMIFIVECVAQKFYGGNKSSAYSALKQSGVWSWYTENYDTTHTLGVEILMDEIGEKLTERGLVQ